MKINYLETYELLLEEQEQNKWGLSVKKTGNLHSFLLFDSNLRVYAHAGLEKIGPYEEIQFISGIDSAISFLMKCMVSFIYPQKLISNREQVGFFEYKGIVALHKDNEIENSLLPKQIQKNFGKSVSDSDQHKNYFLNLSYSGTPVNLDDFIKRGNTYLNAKGENHETLTKEIMGE